MSRFWSFFVAIGRDGPHFVAVEHGSWRFVALDMPEEERFAAASAIADAMVASLGSDDDRERAFPPIRWWGGED